MDTRNMKHQPQPKPRQRGGLFLGIIIGLLVGLALATGVSLYISKVPAPFVNKVPQRTAEQDAAETEKNKSWDPNSGLYGKNPAPPSGHSFNMEPKVIQETAPSASKSRKDSRKSAESKPAESKPADILAGKPMTIDTDSQSTKPSTEALMTYFVQTGAYSNTEDAEQERAKLAMMGYKAKVTEREQSGRTMYRVRLGPFDKRDSADAAKGKLENAGVDAALVQVQK
jgi:cell division protein FtsN